MEGTNPPYFFLRTLIKGGSNWKFSIKIFQHFFLLYLFPVFTQLHTVVFAQQQADAVGRIEHVKEVTRR